ncbi:MAG: helix-hairpin-helix domain-containing protein, partial [Geminicoccales bacterium]
LVTEGFTNIEEIAYVELEEMAAIQGFDESVALALRERAEAYLAEREQELRVEAASLAIEEDLLTFEPLDLETVVALGRKGVKSLDDFADLAADELVELLPGAGLTEEAAGELIMAARAHWFGDEPEAAADVEPEAPSDAEADADETGAKA